MISAPVAALCMEAFHSAARLTEGATYGRVQLISRCLSWTCSVSRVFPVLLLKGKHCEQGSRSYQGDVNKNTSNKNLLYYKCQHSWKKISKLQQSCLYCQSNSQRLVWEATFLFSLIGAMDLWNKWLSCLLYINTTGCCHQRQKYAYLEFHSLVWYLLSVSPDPDWIIGS